MVRLCRASLWIMLACSLQVHAQSTASSAATADASASSAQAMLPDAPVPPAKPKVRVGNWEFYALNSALVGASIADAETLVRCDNCTYVPAPLHRRGLTYGVGLPVDVAVIYLGYELKKKGHRWWYVPGVALTAANAYLSYHWSASTN